MAVSQLGDLVQYYLQASLAASNKRTYAAGLSIELDQFSHSPEVKGGALGKPREGLADVISIHELLTNQILLPSFEAVVT